MLDQNIDLNVKFNYDASYWKLNYYEFNIVLHWFPNIIVVGVYSIGGSVIFNDICIPIVYERMKRIKIIGCDIDITNLMKCVNLRYLFLRANFLTGAKVVNLQYINFDFLQNYSYEIEPYVNNLLKLRYLYVNLSTVCDIYHLLKFTKLRKIMLRGNADDIIFNGLGKLRCIKFSSINSIPDLSCCNKLRRIVIRNCDKCINIDSLRMIKSLRHVVFDNCHRLLRLDGGLHRPRVGINRRSTSPARWH